LIVLKSLSDFSDVKLVTRDSFTGCFSAIKSVSLLATQIADKFYILKNLYERILKIIKQECKRIIKSRYKN